jgi:hypothetical protein
VAQISLLKKVSCTTAAALRYSPGTAVLRCAELYSRCSTAYEYESTAVAAVLGLYSSAVLHSCTRAPAAELYESCSTAVLVLVLGIPTAVGELTYFNIVRQL